MLRPISAPAKRISSKWVVEAYFETELAIGCHAATPPLPWRSISPGSTSSCFGAHIELPAEREGESLRRSRRARIQAIGPKERERRNLEAPAATGKSNSTAKSNSTPRFARHRTNN